MEFWSTNAKLKLFSNAVLETLLPFLSHDDRKLLSLTCRIGFIRVYQLRTRGKTLLTMCDMLLRNKLAPSISIYLWKEFQLSDTDRIFRRRQYDAFRSLSHHPVKRLSIGAVTALIDDNISPMYDVMHSVWINTKNGGLILLKPTGNNREFAVCGCQRTVQKAWMVPSLFPGSLIVVVDVRPLLYPILGTAPGAVPTELLGCSQDGPGQEESCNNLLCVLREKRVIFPTITSYLSSSDLVLLSCVSRSFRLELAPALTARKGDEHRRLHRLFELGSQSQNSVMFADNSLPALQQQHELLQFRHPVAWGMMSWQPLDPKWPSWCDIEYGRYISGPSRPTSQIVFNMSGVPFVPLPWPAHCCRYGPLPRDRQNVAVLGFTPNWHQRWPQPETQPVQFGDVLRRLAVSEKPNPDRMLVPHAVMPRLSI